MIDFRNMSDEVLEESTLKAVRTERKIMHFVLQHLLELEARRIYAGPKYNYDGMFSYMTKTLGYSGTAASLRLQAMKLLQNTPEVFDKIESGSICLSQMAQVQRCITQAQDAGKIIPSEVALEVLGQIEHKTYFESHAVMAKVFDLPIVQYENARPQKDGSVRIEITLTSEQYEELKQSKELLSHVCPHGQWASIITALAKKFNQQKLVGRRKKIENDATAKKSIPVADKALSSDKTHNANDLKPVTSASELKTGKSSEITEAEKTSSSQGRRREYISLHIRRALLARAQNCCEYVNSTTGEICSSRYQLQVDHVKPWSNGGSNKIENLRILCRSHNLMAAEQKGINISQYI